MAEERGLRQEDQKPLHQDEHKQLLDRTPEGKETSVAILQLLWSFWAPPPTIPLFNEPPLLQDSSRPCHSFTLIQENPWGNLFLLAASVTTCVTKILQS